MENFVLAGKAKQVFRTIELAAKRAMGEVVEAVATRQCPMNPVASCSKPPNVSCEDTDCEVVTKIDHSIRGGQH